MNILARCVPSTIQTEGNPAFFRGRIEKMKKDGFLIKVFLVNEGLTVSCPTSLYKLELNKRFDYEQLPGIRIKCFLGTPDSKWPEARDKKFDNLINENKSKPTVKPILLLMRILKTAKGAKLN